MSSKSKWGRIGAALGGLWSLSAYFFGIDGLTYYNWDTANSEMIGINIGQMFGMLFIGGVIGFLAGLVRDLFRGRRSMQ